MTETSENLLEIAFGLLVSGTVIVSGLGWLLQ